VLDEAVGEWAAAGIAGFRCLRPDHVPSQVWRELISAVRTRRPDVSFMAWTIGIGPAEATNLAAACGFDLVACCSHTWDFRAGGFVETVDRLMHTAPLITMPEAPFDRRLGRGYVDTGRMRRAAHRALAFATAYGAGWLMPMGFEFGARRDMDPARDRPEDFARLVAEAPFDLMAEIAATNARHASLPVSVRGRLDAEPVATRCAGGRPAGGCQRRWCARGAATSGTGQCKPRRPGPGTRRAIADDEWSRRCGARG